MEGFNEKSEAEPSRRLFGIPLRFARVLGVRLFVRQSVVRQFAVRCNFLDEREPVVSE
jgi:hypothetical protein